MGESCGTCRFFNEREGECRRFPRSANHNFFTGSHDRYPQMGRSDWCGEYQPVEDQS